MKTRKQCKRSITRSVFSNDREVLAADYKKTSDNTLQILDKEVYHVVRNAKTKKIPREMK